MSGPIGYIQIRAPGVTATSLAATLGLSLGDESVSYDSAGHEHPLCLAVGPDGWVFGAHELGFHGLAIDLDELMCRLTAEGGEASALLEVGHSGSYGVDRWVDGTCVRSVLSVDGRVERTQGKAGPEESDLPSVKLDPETFTTDLFERLGPGWSAYQAADWREGEARRVRTVAAAPRASDGLSPQKLRRRWRDRPVDELKALIYQGRWDEVRAVVGEVDGRLDLRGMPIRSIIKPMSGIDLSYGKIDEDHCGIMGRPAENCRAIGFNFGASEGLTGEMFRCDFSEARLPTLLANCDQVRFDRAKLRGYIGNGRLMRDVSFREAQITRAGFSTTVYERCDFSGALIEANLNHATFLGCDFTGTVFSAMLDDKTVFEGCTGLTDDAFADCDITRSGPVIR